MKEFVILSGPSGYGKSTYADKLFEETVEAHATLMESGEQWGPITAQICSADDYFVTDEGEYKFNPRELPQAHNQCFKDALQAAGDGIERIIIDNTNLRAWEVAPYIAVANAFGYTHRIVRLQCDEKMAFKRSVHGVPEAAHQRMVTSFNKHDFLPFWSVHEVTLG